VGGLILLGRLVALQVVNQEQYALQSEKNHIRREYVTAQRGLVLDRDGRLLAHSRPSFAVVAIPREVLASASCASLLAEILDTTREQIEAKLKTGSRHLPRVLWRDAEFAQISRIAEREEDLPGVSLEVNSVRSYPQGSVAGHLLGHVGEISEQELEPPGEEGFKAGDFLGRTGIEKTYDAELRGVDGERYLEVDAVGRIVGTYRGREPVPPVTGATLQLHLDLRVQAAAESSLAGRRGAVCMMDVRNGGVVAFASAPSLDPNLFAAGIRTDDWKRLNEDPNRPLLNRCTQATYAPGSTFKMITFALAREKNIVGVHGRMRVPCYGGYRFGNRYFRCWEEAGHGSLDLEGALVHSCDTFFYQVGERVEVDDFARISESAGLGAKTGIDLPQESSGNVPTTAWLNERLGPRAWGRGSLLNYSIGQGEYLVTPIQMARHVAAIATDGILYAPRFVREIETSDSTRAPVGPVIAGRWEETPETFRAIREAMRLVVEKGTARGMLHPAFTCAGKTGTAENPHGKPHSWFVGFAPFEHPEVAFGVIVEGGGHGSDVAVPMSRRLLEVYFRADSLAADAKVKTARVAATSPPANDNSSRGAL
jgi:penicillin-binding protein 2